MINPILPTSTIGILGSGQLGRMMALAAKQMGYIVHIYSPGRNTPAGQVADCEFKGAYTDLNAVQAFARTCDVVTYEFENVPAATAEAVAECTVLAPGAHVLRVAQNRIVEKTTLQEAGLAVTPFRPIHTLADLEQAVAELGTPSILKTAASGYDGKGQVKISDPNQVRVAWDALHGVDCVLEAFVEFDCELSVVAARGDDGTFAPFGVVENDHVNHILDVSIAPARVAADVADRAITTAQQVLETLDVVGVLCVEFFVARDGRVLINEIAPRPHNSGHLTIEACPTSQFEQTIRAVCGLPLGETAWRKPTVMVNLLGDLWRKGTPDWAAPLALPDVHLHLYGKQEPRPGRKMGHITVSADTIDEAFATAVLARKKLLVLE